MVTFPRVHNSMLCPVKAWRRYFRSVAHISGKSRAPLLIDPAASRVKLVTQPALRAMLWRALRAAALPADAFTLHSLRRGGASAANQAGVPRQELKRHGLWDLKGETIDLYLDALPIHASAVATAFKRILR